MSKLLHFLKYEFWSNDFLSILNFCLTFLSSLKFIPARDRQKAAHMITAYDP